jgi:predicted RNA-binding protein with TRAM domain
MGEIRMTTKSFVTFFVLLRLFAFSQASQNAAPQPQAPQVKTDSAKQAAQVTYSPPVTILKKAVAFITADCRDGNQSLQPRGTGFFVFVPDTRVGKDGGFVYLATNRHVAEPEKDGHKLTVIRQAVRMNLRTENGEDTSRKVQSR